MAVPFNPAQHGGILESYRMKSRSGITLFIMGAFCVAIALLVFFTLIRGRSPDNSIYALFGIPLGLGILFAIIGIYNMTRSQAFNARVRTLRQNGLVARGSVQHVRHAFRWFGRTFGAGRGDQVGMDTGWFWVVTYKFEDDLGRMRKATGIVPDRLGPKRRNTPNQSTFLDPEMPRVGHLVDILFDYDESVILRLIPVTANI